jgi:tetratricopeptide (TPR) repeat protein
LLPFAAFAMKKISPHRCIFLMRTFARSLVFLSLPIFLLSGCSDDANKGAKLLYSEASQALESSQAGSKSYAEVLVSYKTAKEQIERILREFPSSEIAVGLSSGSTTISGLTLDQFQELEATLKQLVKAEQDPLACALLLAKTTDTALGKSEVLAEIAGKVAESGKKELALELLSKALDGVKTMKDTRLDSRVAGAIAVGYARAGDANRAIELACILHADHTLPPELPEIAGALAKLGQKQQALQILAQARKQAEALENSTEKSMAIAAIASATAELGDFQTAIELTGAMMDGELKSKVFVAIAGKHAANGDFDQAMETAERIRYPWWKGSAWALIANELAKNGKQEQASQLFSKALEMTKLIGSPHDKFMAMVDMAPAFAQGGQREQAMELLAQALEIGRSAYGRWRESWVMASIAIKLAEIGNFQQALDMVELIANADYQSEALAGIASEYGKSGQKEQTRPLLAQALETARTIVDPDDKSRALAGIAGRYAEIGEKEQAIKLLDEALAMAQPKTHKDAYPKFQALGKIAGKYAEIGDFTRAIETTMMIRELSDSKAKSEALAEIARRVVEFGEKDQAERVLSQVLGLTNTMESKWHKAEALAVIAGKYAEIGDLTLAVETAKTIEDENAKSTALAEIALWVAKSGEHEQASQLLAQAIEAAKTIRDGWDRTRALALAELADKAAVAGQKDLSSRLLTEALEAAQTRSGQMDYQKYDALSAIAMRYATNGDFPKAIKTTKMIVAPYWEALALARLADKLAEAGQKEPALQILSHAFEPTKALGGDEKSRALTEIAGVYALTGDKEQASRLLSQALGEARTIEDALMKTWALTEIAREYQKAGQKELSSKLFIEALEAAKTIEEADDKFCEFGEIAYRYAENGDLLQAIAIALSMEDTRWNWKIGTLSDIAGKVAQLREQDKATLIDVTRAIRPWSDVLEDAATPQQQVNGQ